MHPPEVLHQDLGKTHKGMEVQIRMMKRSSFLEGEGGFPQTKDNHSNHKPLHNQMEDGFLSDHFLYPQLLLNLMRTWGT